MLVFVCSWGTVLRNEPTQCNESIGNLQTSFSTGCSHQTFCTLVSNTHKFVMRVLFFYHHVIILGVLMFSRLSEADALLMTILNSSFSMETGYPENSVEPWGGSTNGCKSMCQLKPNQEIWGNSGLMFINWSVLRVCACLYGQAGRLTEFYEMCKSMDFARNFQFPVLEQVCFVVLLIGVVHYNTSSILGISASCTSIMTKNTFYFCVVFQSISQYSPPLCLSVIVRWNTSMFE